jgi:type II secretory pathway pseudopilin PulG
MENASKALLMAGGVLIAVLIIGILLYSFGSMSGYFEEQASQEEIEQLAEFNNQYEAYNRKLLRGTDVVSVLNKAINNNEKYGVNGYNEPNYLIEVEFTIKDTTGNLQDGQTYNISNYEIIKQNSDDFTELKRKIFDCTEIKYDKTTGRVNYILFTERKQNNGI